ncbi:alpha-ketoacid dehydrogenase subunit alpha/beta [Salegentibacter mishustinae]|uniref:3-methyl-2-oxobutanoate dehydrogenase (2-methylpropanoyl-transferring) n=1 Tax=Salegentibacter mishustinae TaxID=270918 RepID=A0A0Q9ZL45_9FLAO|nr:alpha-ketoacid dehydrogenase subunit alpha/beta [Salegentibacter mishustinae]KRG29128.1 transketolase [Salegentibacter mishustinae]PNW22735.1 transketolase [Salegentibacter mishustinae]PZX65166.1 pyruvate/2-oxoglutarate/acetoin dehydrogenase E1 component [Salegentibacter mishustinae]GGW86903.1 transketolase [Salegentibacter mishustinae]
MQSETQIKDSISFEDFKAQVMADYKIAVTSRECSLLGRREVLTGKAKFGIFGDGKEVPQLAMAKAFKNGDFRSGYYRDQTFMMAINQFSIEHFFAGLYADSNLENEPMSGGRQMGGHFTTHSLNEDGSWKNLMEQKNSSADISPTAGQMPRLLGLAQASKIYRNVEGISSENFSEDGNEIAWGTIGNASTSEGHFWETLNAAGVLQVPMILSVWDDEYGISVHAKHQTTKENISEIVKGFQRDEENKGYEIIVVNGWDYVALIEAYEKAEKIARKEHCPVLIHVVELTQPQGHSTSGSHERYKDEKRLSWEREYDCNVKLREWIIENNISTDEELEEIEKEIKREVREGKKTAWEKYLQPTKAKQKELLSVLSKLAKNTEEKETVVKLAKELNGNKEPLKKDLAITARKTLRAIRKEDSEEKSKLIDWLNDFDKDMADDYNSHLYIESNGLEAEVLPEYNEDSAEVDGRIILRDNFDQIFGNKPETLIFGEDAGEIGDVNQGLEGLQDKYGKLRVADVGIREATILGQGIGMAMRGLRPIAEIQYLDYVMYALQGMSDDLATLQYRTKGKQKAPLIIRTRGHRLEGIWHSGSQMGGILNLVRGMYVLVPRNMTKAAGFYNTLLEQDTPALLVECLNGYRLKEKKPSNLPELRTPIGKVETIREGSDITLISYGSTLRIVAQTAEELSEFGINAEVIDVQSLLPFDLDHDIVKSVKKTNRLLVIDEDVPGGASAFILDKVLNEQNAWRYLDSKPQTLTAKEHRPAYGTDGDYFSKPSAEDIFEKVYSIFNEVNPEEYPAIR